MSCVPKPARSGPENRDAPRLVPGTPGKPAAIPDTVSPPGSLAPATHRPLNAEPKRERSAGVR